MTRKMLLAAAAAFTVLAGGSAQASISGLYNTGVVDGGSTNGMGAGVASGNGGDANWQLNEGPTYMGLTNGQFPTPYWLPDNNISRWITPSANAGDSYDPSANGYYKYALTFSVTNPGHAGFAGQFLADNLVNAITLNGNAIYTGPTDGSSQFGSWTSFSAPSADFVAGNNTLVVHLENYAQGSGNPTGLNVEFTSVAGGVPEPASWSLMILGVGAVGGALRRRRQALAAA